MLLKSAAVMNNATLRDDINKNFDKVAPIAFIYERDTENSKTISKSLRNFYFADAQVDNSTLSNLARVSLRVSLFRYRAITKR